MTVLIHAHMAADHDRLDEELSAATVDAGVIALEPYSRFRVGLLRHIGMEEKILFPALREEAGYAVVADLDQLRADHSRIVALLVASPSAPLVEQLRELLGPHNALEESADGVYARCDRLAVATQEALLARLHAARVPPVRPFFDGQLPARAGTPRPSK